MLDPEGLERWGFHADAPRLGQAFSSLFVHANTAHLLGNLVFLAAVGAAAELAAGPVRFALVYFASGLAGVGLYWLASRRIPDPPLLVGASGAVAGAAAYYALRYHSLRVAVAPGRALSLAAVVAVWVGLQLVGALVSLGGPVAGRAYFAHLGGAAVGLMLGFAWRSPDLGTRRLGHEALDRMNERGPDATVRAAREHLARHPDDPAALARLANALRDLGEDAQESEALLRLIRVSEGETRRGAIGRALELDPARIPVRRRIQLAESVAADDRALAERLLRSAADHGEGEDRADALLSRARLDDPPDPTLLDRIEAEHPLSAAADWIRRRKEGR